MQLNILEGTSVGSTILILCICRFNFLIKERLRASTLEFLYITNLLLLSFVNISSGCVNSSKEKLICAWLPLYWSPKLTSCANSVISVINATNQSDQYFIWKRQRRQHPEHLLTYVIYLLLSKLWLNYYLPSIDPYL